MFFRNALSWQKSPNKKAFHKNDERNFFFFILVHFRFFLTCFIKFYSVLQSWIMVSSLSIRRFWVEGEGWGLGEGGGGREKRKREQKGESERQALTKNQEQRRKFHIALLTKKVSTPISEGVYGIFVHTDLLNSSNCFTKESAKIFTKCFPRKYTSSFQQKRIEKHTP